MSAELFTIKTHTVPAAHVREYPQTFAPSNAQETALQISAKQYIPRRQHEDKTLQDGVVSITILAATALGVPKECYEPFFDALLLRSFASKNSFPIGSIWIADVTHEGTSSVLNERVLGAENNWFDHSRDLLHLINTHRESFPRPIVGIGHSRGCAQLAHLAHMHPRLLSTCIFVEPLMLDGPFSGPHAAYFATKRADLWPSRQEAEEQLRKTAPYKSWDPRVLRRYLDVGLRPTPTEIYPGDHKDVKSGSVTLTTTKHQEAWSFTRAVFQSRFEGAAGDVEELKREKLLIPDLDLETYSKYSSGRAEPTSAFLDLPRLRPSVFYVFGGRSPFSSAAAIERKVSSTGVGLGGSGGVPLGKVDKVVLAKLGHFALLEQPDEVAAAGSGWLDRWILEWRRVENFLNSVGAEQSENGQGKRVSPAWIEMTKKPAEDLRPVLAKEKL